MNGEKQPVNIVIIGASLDTGNLGVSALLASTVAWIYKVSPHARIKLFDGVPNPTPQVVTLQDGRSIHMPRVGIRKNKTIWRQNNIVRLFAEVFICRLLSASLRKRIFNSNSVMRDLQAADIVLDITGGDSFTDIYGPWRFIQGFLSKLLVIVCGKDLVLLPQTYGPFQNSWAKILAKHILLKAQAVYSRDEQGIKEIEAIVGDKIKPPFFCPDVAFGLHSYEPKTISVTPNFPEKKKAGIIVGLNVSGLLYFGGYSRNNMFNLKGDYKKIVISLVTALLERENVSIILVPHVFPKEQLAVESDPQACAEVYNEFYGHYPGRVFLLGGRYDQSEIKWIIGKCDFFIGSRMHACIAAASQGIPAVSLAYSKKFKGVYQSIGIEKYVVDLRELEVNTINQHVLELFDQRDDFSTELDQKIKNAKLQLYNTFSSLLGGGKCN